MYDVLVIGGGPGGYAAALRASEREGKVAVVESADLGGTCVNRGCIASMVWLKAAEHLDAVQEGEVFGIKAKVESVNLNAIVERKDAVAAGIREGMEGLLESRDIEVIQGTATLKSAREVVVGDQVLSAKAIVVATGSRIAMPEVEGIAEAAMTTDDLLSMKKIPASVLVLGGGHREVEIAGLFRAFGAEVFMAPGAEGILPREEDEISQRVTKALFDRGVKVFPRVDLASVKKSGKLYQVVLSGAKEETLKVEVVLVSARKANTEGLGLEAVGVQLDEDGAVQVNDKLETNVEGIYAVGDVTGGPMLSHAATAMGKVAAENAMGGQATYASRLVPRGMWGNPEMGAVGLTEEEADDQDLDVEVSEFPYAINGLAMAQDEGEGTVKIVTDAKYGEILGVHAVGVRATEIIGEAVLAMELECTAEEWAAGVRLHPTYSETIVDAARMLLAG